MGRKIVHDHDVARLEGWNQHLFDIGQEGLTIHRPVQHPCGGEAVAAQSGGEGGGFPVAEGSLADQSLAGGAAAPGADHLGIGASLVDEHQLARIKAGLAGLPFLSRLGDVGPVLFGRVQSFF